MRSLDFSNDNVAVQWQYVKRNFGELGILYQFDDFEFQARGIIQRLIQSCVNEEFALQIRANRYEHAPIGSTNVRGPMSVALPRPLAHRRYKYHGYVFIM
jgi:hypothetical protein